ncbi:MAG: DUF1592 domain-containing protein [Planctomycetota bacterium]
MAVLAVALFLVPGPTGLAGAQESVQDSSDRLKNAVTPLLESSCLYCHEDDAESGLNIADLDFDLNDQTTFDKWERVFFRVESGEMPPSSEGKPDHEELEQAMSALQEQLTIVSRRLQQETGRVQARRLTKLEFGNTLRDLLDIDGDIESVLPDEVESGTFDTVGANQRISAVHLESYLSAADNALDHAIHLERYRFRKRQTDFSWLREWHDKPIDLGGSVTRETENGIALFVDTDYLTGFQFNVLSPGIHRLTCEVAAYQTDEPVTLKVILKHPGGGATLLKAHDLVPNEAETIEIETWMDSGDSAYLTFDADGVIAYSRVFAVGGSANYRGKGIEILSQIVEGPIYDSWPPASTANLFHGIEIAPAGNRTRGPFELVLERSAESHVDEIVHHLAPRLFRRPVDDQAMQPFVSLASPAISEGRDFADVLRLPLRAMISSPQFLLFDESPGELDGYALASRLSYFLWKSAPDKELYDLAEQGTLTEPEVLRAQVERMLDDGKAYRFVTDFTGQWLRLDKINATTPDEDLYPEFDEILGNSLVDETQLFFEELVRENLSVTNLVDSEFTFVNRRLAEHYGLPPVEGQHFRKVVIPEGSPRGGVLTHAAVLKTTANGTVTSPVTRGNFVLSNLLGTPLSPPPPNVGSIEPDTRGTTTIREMLEAHRNVESCAACHRHIDPPGFALESFDPIGGFRTRYRASTGERKDPFDPRQMYVERQRVDAGGVTADGREFDGIEEYKQRLIQDKEQVARNFVSQLVVYSTGGEVQFADRAVIEEIVARSREAGFPVRDLIHEVVQSRMFREK